MSVSRSADRSAKAQSQTADALVPEESDGCVVPSKGSNKGAPGRVPAESLEGRRPTKENTEQRGLVPDTVPDMGEADRLHGVRKAAKRDKRMRFTALLHHVTVDRLRSSFFALKREAAPGIDGVTWRAYLSAHGTNLDTRLQELHERVHRGSYRAQPSKRAYIPKADGRLRPLVQLPRGAREIATAWDAFARKSSGSGFARSVDGASEVG